ncbi:D-2-hydroxyacid dehydrogenase [Bradyrhizobium sp. NAS96.2]|uniref:D-2-hydroxyacid dehydrogenase n=1 Tax=Bradyrhizobium sp. NAS96.2 TaxID=1680160 RepID=UPI00093A1646|nr:D-2-hydroxyacid dehydrogenase [Bradyrhizobium sp. NAS96.2]OKO75191.1 phosphoglycerate dehydrogenase [Bradyrhizobium sp. NAS96.2]
MKVLCLWHTTDEELRYIKDAVPRGTEVVSAEGEFFSRWESTFQQLKRHAVDADVFMGFALPKGILEIAKNLKFLNWLHTGVDDLELIGGLALAKQRGFKVANMPGAYALPLAEQVMMFALALAKNTLVKHQAAANNFRYFPPRSPGYRSAMLHGRTMGLIGVGGIGTAVAKLAKGFSMRVIGIRRRKDKPVENIDAMCGMDELHSFLGECDYVVLAVPSTADTDQMFGRAEIEAMKPSAFLINIARGNLVQEKALYEALTSGRLRGYGSDVWPRYDYGRTWPTGGARLPIQSLPNVVASIHQGGDADDMEERILELGTQNLVEFLTGKPLTYGVNIELGY